MPCRKLRSPNVVSYFGSFVTMDEHRTFGTLVLEYCDSTLDEVRILLLPTVI